MFISYHHSRVIEGNDRLYVQDIIQCLHGPCCPCAPGGPIAPRGMEPMGEEYGGIPDFYSTDGNL